MKKIFLLLPLMVLISCTKYGAESEQGKEGATPALETSAAASAPPHKFPALVAVPYVLPAEISYNMRCDLNSVAGIGLDPGVITGVKKSESVVFNGWLVDEKLTVPGEFLVVLKAASSYAILGVAGMDRPDVEQALSAQSARPSGYGFQANIMQVQAGQYSVHLVEPRGGSACDTTKLINVID